MTINTQNRKKNRPRCQKKKKVNPPKKEIKEDDEVRKENLQMQMSWL